MVTLPSRAAGLLAPLWERMDRQPRHRPTPALKAALPDAPGVYAWYRNGHAVYVGKADLLGDRVWTKHMGQSRSLRTSSFRRNVAELLGFGSARDIYLKVVRLTDDQRAAVRAWIEGCEVAWVVTETAIAAELLEGDMKLEWIPPLTKR